MSYLALVKELGDLVKGDILYSDVYKNGTLLLSGGTLINRTAIEKLINWNISTVEVLEAGESIQTNQDTWEVKKKTSILYSKGILSTKKLFYDSLIYVVNESRYGYVLHDNDKLMWLENLFIHVMEDDRISNAVFNLKKLDSYSYYHSFDVFLLGSLLANEVGIRELDIFAACCLVHDIGKLQISKELLNKEEKLTKSDFDILKSHTMEGVTWTKKNKLPKIFETICKSHHERLDGSGYPNGLTDKDISKEIRIMGIVDSYSALTLKRSYREPILATKAIELLLNKKKKYDLMYLISFIELLNIYPPDSIVKLSNGKKARVKVVNDQQPYRPTLQELGSSVTFELPTNLSVTIPKFIRWDHVEQEAAGSKREQYWNLYINNLIAGDWERAFENYKNLIDGLTVENVFIDVVVKTIKEIDLRWDTGQLSVGEEHDALLGIQQILQHMHKEQAMYTDTQR